MNDKQSKCILLRFYDQNQKNVNEVSRISIENFNEIALIC